MDEAAEGGEAGAGGDHDDWDGLAFGGQVEGLVGWLDGDVHDVTGRQVREVVAGHADVAALARHGRRVEDGVGEGDDVGVAEGRGGDAVLADTHGDEGGDKSGEWEGELWEALEQVEKGDALGGDFIGKVLVGCEGLERCLCLLVRSYGDEHGNVALGCGLRQLEVGREERVRRDRGVGRQSRASLRGDVQNAVPGKVEAGCHAVDRLLRVERKDGEVVTSAVSHASWQLNLDMSLLRDARGRQRASSKDFGLAHVGSEVRRTSATDFNSKVLRTSRGLGFEIRLVAAVLLFHRRPQHLILPSLELAHHVTLCCISASAGTDTVTTVGGELVVNERRHTVEGGFPVRVTSTKNRMASVQLLVFRQVR